MGSSMESRGVYCVNEVKCTLMVAIFCVYIYCRPMLLRDTDIHAINDKVPTRIHTLMYFHMHVQSFFVFIFAFSNEYYSFYFIMPLLPLLPFIFWQCLGCVYICSYIQRCRSHPRCTVPQPSHPLNATVANMHQFRILTENCGTERVKMYVLLRFHKNMLLQVGGELTS